MKKLYEHYEKFEGDINDNMELLDIINEYNKNYEKRIYEEYFNDGLTVFHLEDKYIIFRTVENRDGYTDAFIYETSSYEELLDYIMEETGLEKEEVVEIHNER